MRVRIPLTPIVAVAALVSACSNPPADPSAALDADFAADLELALFPEAAAGQSASPVISALELAQADEVGQSTAVAPARSEPRPSATTSASVALLGQPVPAPEIVEEVSAAPISVALLGPMDEGEAGATDHDDHAGRDGPSWGDIGTIIIRGGVSDRDDCKLHLPGAGRLGPGSIAVLVNDRAPRLGGRGNTTYPARRPAAGPRMGGIFAGGIR